MINRRSLITGLISLAAAPAIVRANNLTPVKVIKTITHEELIQAIINAQMAAAVEFLKEGIERNLIYGSGGFRVESADDSVIFTPVHNYLKLDQSISAKDVDPIKIINPKDYEV